MRALLKASISRRLYGLIALFALGFAGIVGFQLFDLRRNLEDFKHTEIQSVVESAAGIAKSYYERAQAGEFSDLEAQTRAKEAIRGIRYQGEEYLFVDDYNYVNIAHGLTPATEGKQREAAVDSAGHPYVKERIDTTRAQGEGFFTYKWESPEGVIYDKLSYAKAFEPWSWVIATGVLTTNVDAAFNEAAVTSATITIAVIVTLIGIGVLLARSISLPLGRMTESMRQLASGRFDLQVPGKDRRDEIGAMAGAVEVFRQNGLKVAEMTEAEAARIVADQQARQAMMSELQDAFGTVVDAAVAGDFSKRVAASFPDPELNALASGINNLVAVIDDSIGETGAVLSALAETDLTRRVTGAYQGALAKLKDDTNAVADNLTQVVSQLRVTSGALKAATGEILAGANDLSERTTKQAATIEETSAAMEQLAQTVADNARKSEEAAVRTQSAARLADEGGQVMTQATLAMERISTSSSKVSDIIGMIDDIAFQTNLLALNASVEAARAGEAGKGFAVVAVEVRRLAQSAAQASSEVKALIEQSATEVQGGSKLVADAAAKLTAILQAVQENSSLMQAISAASAEQSSAIGEVTQAVRQMDEMTQHNAALVEETNAAIEQTEAQATELDRVIEVFRLEDAARSPAAAKRPQAQPTGIKALHQKVKAAAKSYLSHGNAAVDRDWEEF